LKIKRVLDWGGEGVKIKEGSCTCHGRANKGVQTPQLQEITRKEGTGERVLFTCGVKNAPERSHLGVGAKWQEGCMKSLRQDHPEDISKKR